MSTGELSRLLYEKLFFNNCFYFELFTKKINSVHRKKLKFKIYFFLYRFFIINFIQHYYFIAFMKISV